MIIKNVSGADLSKSLELLNRKYDNNIIWNRYQQLGKTRFSVTLRVVSSKEAGHRLGFYRHPKTKKRRRLSSACWHVHGDFFDILLRINPDVVIRSMGRIINKNGGNWKDWNIGSMMGPYMYSDACECNSYLKPEKVIFT